jgi:fumarate reductase flavoprotein subunit
MRPLNTKKLYAIKLRSYFFSSYGGLVTSRDHQVLDKNNKPIQGLYAVGLEVSNMVGPTYTTWTSGHAFGFASYSGRHAALNAVAAMK